MLSCVTVSFASAQTLAEGLKAVYYEKYKTAGDIFRKLVAANPADADANYWLGQVAISQPNRDLELAKSIYTKALVATNQNPLIVVGMGHVELMEGKATESKAHFTAALAATNNKKGGDPKILTAVGRANADGDSKTGEVEFAIEKLNTAAKLDLKDPGIFVLEGISHLKRGREYGGDAKRAFEAALERDPRYAQAKYRIARIFMSQNNKELFLPMLEEAAQMDPAYGPAWLALYDYYAERDVNKATDYMEKYLAVADKDCETDFFYADYLFRAGKYQESLAKAKELEAAICKKFGSKYAQLVSSGTAALTTAMSALGIGYGDEIILPAFTFVASFEAVLSVGAIPVLVDVDDTLTLNPAAVRNAITPKTKCIMPVHMCGSMADMDALVTICKEHNLILLEDACQSIGASYKGKMLGTIGDAGTFSFDFVKTMTCAEGGVVMTNNEEIFIKSDGYTDHGHDHKGADRGADLHPFIGYNYRISELHAAVGLAQIRRVPEFLSIQKNNHTQLKNILSEIPEVSFRRIPDPNGDSCTFLSWFLPTEEITRAVVAEMKAQGILPGNFYWFDNNWHYLRKWDHLKNAITLNALHPDLKAKVIEYSTKDFAASDAIMGRCISTAISLLWSEDQIKDKGEKMVNAIRKVLASHSVLK